MQSSEKKQKKDRLQLQMKVKKQFNLPSVPSFTSGNNSFKNKVYGISDAPEELNRMHKMKSS